MSDTRDRTQNKVTKKSITRDTATDNALWRLSLVLKEIAELTMGGDKEKTQFKSAARVKLTHSKKAKEESD